MGHTDRAALHWPPLAATERERLFDTLDAFLARQPPVSKPDEPAREAYDCPGCGHPGELFRRHYRYGSGGLDCCPLCGWEESLFRWQASTTSSPAI